jgi:erythronate-4-phosphate dehydrogenase
MSLNALAEFYHLNKEPVLLIREPALTNSVIDLNKYRDSDNRVYDAILETYNPADDHSRLIGDPAAFKKLRNEYPLRREYLAYEVINATDEEAGILSRLGFNVG